MQAVRLYEEIDVPSGVSITVDGMKVTVKGPKGQIVRDFSYARGMMIKIENNKVVIERYFAKRKDKAEFYSIVRHIQNMFTGVTKGYRYSLKVLHSHFPITVKVVGNEIQITNLIGEKNIRRAKIPQGVKVNAKGEDIVIEGIDIEAVGQAAASIERATKLKDVDRRVFMDGIFLSGKEVIQ